MKSKGDGVPYHCLEVVSCHIVTHELCTLELQLAEENRGGLLGDNQANFRRGF